MTNEERLKFFSDNFDLIATGAYSRGPKKFISDGDSRLCRFCQKSDKETTFKTESHAIPECLGNHQLILLDECDNCNKFFSEKLEDHLDKYTKPYRTAGQIAGKSGIPNYKTLNKNSRIDFKKGPEIRTPDEEDFMSIDHEKKEITLNFHQESHIPLAAYKALIKIAISIIEDKSELTIFRSTINWLLDPELKESIIKPAILMESFIPGPRPTNGVIVSLFRRKTLMPNIPYAIAIIAFGNIVFQIIVPSQLDANRKMTCSIPFFPSPFELHGWPYGTVKHSSIDLSSTEKIRKKFPIIYSFDSTIEQDLINSE